MTRQIVSILLALLAGGCHDSIGPTREDVAVSPEWVTGPAAAALDASNRFIFAPRPTGPDELSSDQARIMAKAFYTWLASSVGDLKDALEEQHGGSINFAAVTPCDRVIPISAPFLPADIPAEAQYVRDAMAARYEVELCQRDVIKAVGLDVSITTKVTVTAEGTLRWPEPPIITGNDFFAFGIPRRPEILRDGSSYGLWALSPEAAVRAIYTLLHIPVQTVPEATGCLWVLIPCIEHGARLWRMETAQPVLIRRQGAAEDELAQVFYVQVGLGANTPGGVYVAALVQPSPAYLVYHYVRDQQNVTDSVLLTLSGPLAMDSFIVAGAPSP